MNMQSQLNFKPMGASILPSQAFEAIIQKQVVLAGIGQSIRNTLSKLTPEFTERLLANYGEPEPDFVKALEVAMTERELDVVINENTPDPTYMKGAEPKADYNYNPDGADDEWNRLGM